MTDAELYARANETAVASWEAYARGATEAEIRRGPGMAAGVFPHGPERDVYNNALPDRDLGEHARATALDAIEVAYATAGVERFAVWVHETDAPLRADLERRGYTLDTTTRAMAMPLVHLRPIEPPLAELRPADWPTYLRALGIPGLLTNAGATEFHALVGHLDGEDVASGLAYDHRGDCGIYNVGTHAHARRRGLGSAITARLAHDGRARGCETASLQATPMAEHLYAALGFRDLGRILEFTRTG